jgi:hypothetical protein
MISSAQDRKTEYIYLREKQYRLPTVLLKPKKGPLSVNTNNHVHVTSSLDAAINFTAAKEANEASS